MTLSNNRTQEIQDTSRKKWSNYGSFNIGYGSNNPGKKIKIIEDNLKIANAKKLTNIKHKEMCN